MTLDSFFILALIGCAAGFMAGLLGIGGGLIMVPFITYQLTQQGVSSDLAIKMAIVTSMSTIVFTSVSSIRAHQKHGAIRWNLVRGLTPGIILGGGLASLWIFSILKGSTLAVLFSLFVIFSATQMFLNKRPKPTRQLPGFKGLFGMGSVIGFLSGLVGAGGAFVSVPFITWCNVAIHNAVATSAALGFPIALANVLGYIIAGQNVANLPAYSFGYIWLPALAIIASCSVLLAPWGARAAHRLPVAQLKRVFASVLYLLAAYMLYTAFSA
jgi:uncharacterized membrane protein YfcA